MLNVMDIVFTLFLLDTGYYVEINPVMANIVETPLVAIIIKTILPGYLLILVFNSMKKAIEHQLRSSNFFINGALLLYILINIFHLIWLAILPVF